MSLNDSRFNEHSQFGEDGILESIFTCLGVQRGFCVEFGAADGFYMSNTARLLNRGWRGVLVEGDPEKFKKLYTNRMQWHDRARVINRLVGLDGDDTLDKILNGLGVPTLCDLLSIDIDGNDYHVWDTIARRPTVVVIEFNPTIPLDVDFVQPRDLSVFQGSSLKAMCRLARAKDYDLVACTDTNAIFVTASQSHHFEDVNKPELLWVDRAKYLTHIFSLYDGTVKLAGMQKLPWHQRPMMSEDAIQVLAPSLRKFPGAL